MSKSKTEQRMSESEKLLQFNSSGSETEEWNNLQGSKFRNSNLLPTYSRSETRRCHSTCMTSLPLDYSNRRQCQILGTLIVLTICIYFLLSKNLFQDDGMVLVRNQIIPQNFTTSPKSEIGPNGNSFFGTKLVSSFHYITESVMGDWFFQLPNHLCQNIQIKAQKTQQQHQNMMKKSMVTPHLLP